jgi:hypothetical protein
MIKVGDTFIADGHEWKVTEIDVMEGVYVEWKAESKTYLINVCTPDEAVFVYRKFKNGNTRGLWWTFSFDEIKMIHEIIGKVEE